MVVRVVAKKSWPKVDKYLSLETMLTRREFGVRTHESDVSPSSMGSCLSIVRSQTSVNLLRDEEGEDAWTEMESNLVTLRCLGICSQQRQNKEIC